MKASYTIAIQLYEEALANGQDANECHICGASITDGLKGCFEQFAELGTKSYVNPNYGRSYFYGVDAHALQHPEIHGKKNNAAHLLRLCWLFAYDQHEQSHLVPKWWQQYLSRAEIPILEPPLFKQRGNITIATILQAQNDEEHLQLMRDWAESVYQAWQAHHDWAKAELTQIFS